MLMQLIYSSVAVKPLTTQELESLLTKARSRNHACGITGMLLYDYGAFLQVLEGPRHGVEEVFASILRDPVHRSVHTLEREPIVERSFAHWSMGFVDLHSGAPPSGATVGWKELVSGDDAGSRAKRYLQIFQAELYRELTKKPK